MKKLSIIAIASLLFITTACQSAGKNIQTEESDYYDGENTTSKIKSSENNHETQQKSSTPFISFGNTSKFTVADECSLFARNSFGGLKQKKASVVINNKSKKIGFGSSVFAAYYYFFLEPSDLTKLSIAFDNYQKDFSEKKLDRKARNKYKKYGNINAEIYWGSIQASTPNNGTGPAYFGYEFVDKSPYFTITMHPVYNKYYEVTDTVDTESIQITYYFTKNQMKDLLNYLAPENLNKFTNGYIDEDSEESLNGDEYEE